MQVDNLAGDDQLEDFDLSLKEFYIFLNKKDTKLCQFKTEKPIITPDLMLASKFDFEIKLLFVFCTFSEKGLSNFIKELVLSIERKQDSRLIFRMYLFLNSINVRFLKQNGLNHDVKFIKKIRRCLVDIIINDLLFLKNTVPVCGKKCLLFSSRHFPQINNTHFNFLLERSDLIKKSGVDVDFAYLPYFSFQYRKYKKNVYNQRVYEFHLKKAKEFFSVDLVYPKPVGDIALEPYEEFKKFLTQVASVYSHVLYLGGPYKDLLTCKALSLFSNVFYLPDSINDIPKGFPVSKYIYSSNVYKDRLLELGVTENKLHYAPGNLYLARNLDTNRYKRTNSYLNDKPNLFKHASEGVYVLSALSFARVGKAWLSLTDVDRKGLLDLLNQFPNVCWVIVGAGNKELFIKDNVFQTHEFKESVLFVDSMPYDEFLLFLSNCDLFLNLPASTGGGSTIRYCMKFGLPALSSYYSDASSTLPDICVYQSFDDILSKLHSLLSNENFYKECIHKQFSVLDARGLDDIVECYSELFKNN